MLIDELKQAVGPGGWTDAADELEPHLREWRDMVVGKTMLMVSPASVEEVSEIVRLCSAAGVGIVPQGGNTGLCAGAIPDSSGEQVLLSMSRLNKIRSIDRDDFSMVAEAGCVLAGLQEAAAKVDRFFPLSLGSEGSCQIGGNLSTNAGGINVIRYGTARDQVLGLEVVLADGTILNRLRSLRKDTAGYDLKHLFVGSEGTLGVITAACLRLYPDPGETVTALVGLESAKAAVELLGDLRERLADRIQAFELVSHRAFDYVERHVPGCKLPLDRPHSWYVLLEAAVSGSVDVVEQSLMPGFERGLLQDAAVAKNSAEASRLWRMRHSISEAEKHEGNIVKHDISLPIGCIQDFLDRGDRLLAEHREDVKLVAFGHLGDGNLHYNVQLPNGLGPDELHRRGLSVTEALYDLVDEFGGSFSAEHGVGLLKKAYLSEYRSDAEVQLMRTLKQALDPAGVMNPGKLL